MTNRDKFIEVFKVDYIMESPSAACFLCTDEECKKTECKNCRFWNWWHQEFKTDEKEEI